MNLTKNINSELGRSHTHILEDMGKLHPINKEQHCCWMRTEAFIPVCFHWILFKNTSCRHQRTMAHHWKNSVPTPGSVAQYLFCQGFGCCALLRPRLLKAVSDTRDQLYATTRFKLSKNVGDGACARRINIWRSLDEKSADGWISNRGWSGGTLSSPFWSFNVLLKPNHCWQNRW